MRHPQGAADVCHLFFCLVDQGHFFRQLRVVDAAFDIPQRFICISIQAAMICQGAGSKLARSRT